MRTSRAALAAIAVLLSACASAQLEEATAEQSPALTPTVSETPISTATLSPSSTPAPSASPSTATPLPTAFGASIFADPDDCENPVFGYRVAYPSSWYSNAAADGISACWMFAPTDFEVRYGTEIPSKVAIIIRRFDEYDPGSFEGEAILSDVPATIAGNPARVQEVEFTVPNIAFAAGQHLTRHIIELSDGTYLVGETYLGPDYESARTVLEDMMQTLELVSP